MWLYIGFVYNIYALLKNYVLVFASENRESCYMQNFLASTKYNITKQLQCHWSSLWTLRVNKGPDLRVLHNVEVYESRPSCPAFLYSSVWWCFERKSWASWCRSCAACWRWKYGMQLTEEYPVLLGFWSVFFNVALSNSELG